MPWRLLFANLMGNKVRSLLTFLSMMVAVFAVCFLRTIVVSLEAGVKASSSDRLIVQSAVSLFVYLPHSYGQKIQQVKGVDHAMKMNWFGGVYIEPKNFFAQFAVEHEKLLDVYPEIKIVEGSIDEFKRKRNACVVGIGLIEQYGWKVGDTIPIKGTIFPRTDNTAWEFEIAAVYNPTKANVDPNTLYFHFDYLEESLDAGAAAGPQGAGIYILKTGADADVVTVSNAIDSLFYAGPQRVQTTTEAEFQRTFVTMLGSVPTLMNSIGSAIIFAILLAVTNTMLMAGRQRVKAFGVLKALGFTDSVAFQLMLFESLLLSTLGGLVGVGLAIATQPTMQNKLSGFVPVYLLTNETAVFALVLSLVIGVIAGILPAIQARNLSCVEALRATV